MPKQTAPPKLDHAGQLARALKDAIQWINSLSKRDEGLARIIRDSSRMRVLKNRLAQHANRKAGKRR